MTRYTILTHSNAGGWKSAGKRLAKEAGRPDAWREYSRAQARQALAPAREILGNCDILGLETTCLAEFTAQGVEAANAGKTVVVATGDGGFGAVAAAVPAGTVLGYLPGGTGCAMGYVARYPRKALLMRDAYADLARRIRDGRDNPLTLMELNGTRGMFGSVGFEGKVLQARERPENVGGLRGYLQAGAIALAEHEPAPMGILADGQRVYDGLVATLVLSTVPFMGYGARFGTDKEFQRDKIGYTILPEKKDILTYFARSLTGLNHPDGLCATLEATTSAPLSVQMNGDCEPAATEFRAIALPGLICLRH